VVDEGALQLRCCLISHIVTHGLRASRHGFQGRGGVVGVIAEGPLAGGLRVQGDETSLGRKRRSRDGIAVYAIPRSAVVRRRQDSLLLGAPLGRARATWLMHVLQARQQGNS
jgi:hypothetical protein